MNFFTLTYCKPNNVLFEMSSWPLLTSNDGTRFNFFISETFFIIYSYVYRVPIIYAVNRCALQLFELIFSSLGLL